MNREFLNAQKPTRGQFCQVTVSVRKEQNATISDLRIRQRAAAPTTHGLTSSPSSKYSNSHSGSASSNAARSSVVPALAIVPRYTIAHPSARSSATRRGVSGEIDKGGASAVDGGQSMPLERTPWAAVRGFAGHSCGVC